MRERFTGGILHWKMMLFSGQGIVEFSGANYSPDAWMPLAMPLYSNYVDEAILFTGKSSIVNSFRTQVRRSLAEHAQLPRLREHHAARRRASTTSSRRIPSSTSRRGSRTPTARPSATTTSRKKIDVIMYRITDQRHTNAMIAAHNRGIPVRLISEPKQYRDPTRLWHSWNIDRMYMAGIHDQASQARRAESSEDR